MSDTHLTNAQVALQVAGAYAAASIPRGEHGSTWPSYAVDNTLTKANDYLAWLNARDADAERQALAARAQRVADDIKTGDAK